jgi:signal transduction histidine kinase
MIKNRKESTGLMKTHSVVLLLQGIHCANFALFRMEENAQLWGWPVSYALYQMIATTLPAITLNFFHKKEKEKLETLVRARTEKISLALEQKEHVFRILSHDISNPLSILKLNLGLYEKKIKTEQEVIEATNKVVQRITEIIEQARILNQVEHNINDLPVTAISFNESIKEIQYLFQESLKKKNIGLILDIQTTSSDKFLADKSSFENSVLSNFLSNAVKFSFPNNNIKISTMKNHENLVIKIRDDGFGIPEEILFNIFKPNTSSSRKGTENESGNGMGMSIAKKYIQYFKGNIEIDSKDRSQCENSYTEITISFPRFKSA